MSSWKQLTWGDVTTLEYGKGLRDYQFGQGSVPVYGTNGAIGWTDQSLYDHPSVIIGRKGAYRGVHFADRPFYVIDTAFYLKPKQISGLEIDPKWAYFCLLTYDINSLDSGSAIPSTSRSDFYALPLLLPPLAEQREIAAILGSLDDKIDLNRRMNATLEAIARAIFQSWFVDFDPVRAKAEGRQPDGMDAETAALFPDSFEESPLGLIPSGWRVCRVADICSSILSGGTPSTQNPEYWNGDIPWLASGETREHFITSTEKTITRLGVERSSTRLARAGTTVIAGAGQGHTRGQASLLLFESYINQSVVGVMANRDYASDLYVYFDLSRRYEEMRRISDAHSSRGSLTTRLVGDLRIVVPTIPVAAAFDRLAKPLVDHITNRIGESRVLADLRDALLPKLISGQIQLQLLEIT